MVLAHHSTLVLAFFLITLISATSNGEPMKRNGRSYPRKYQLTEVDGNWSEWSVWSKCYSNSVRYRIRTCSNPAPLQNGSLCKIINGDDSMQIGNKSWWDHQVDKCQPKSKSKMDVSGVTIACLSGVVALNCAIMLYTCFRKPAKEAQSENRITPFSICEMAEVNEKVQSELVLPQRKQGIALGRGSTVDNPYAIKCSIL